ncbi:MAG: CPBP family intramembrane metalloprotease [Spirochaetae bacterium HGW-Spirochaetae-5]|nr:MAG: CPBP family intramembrane metalloprotease [Spirochaetae bacterium HGW-Spirochaetae-5]
MPVKKLSSVNAIAVFMGFTVYFFILLFTLLPYLKNNYSINSALYWFITGYFLFIPLFVYSIAAVRREGSTDVKSILQALNIKPFSQKDLIYSISGLLLVFICTGVIFGVSFLLNKYYGIRLLSTTPWFIVMHPFQGSDRLLLLVWFPMFFFNIAGEEMLWRGYIQTRLNGRYAWLLCSLLWMIFHLPFGIDLMIILIPVIIIIPYVYSKTDNTLTGIFIHGFYNGPIFVMAALGIVK